MIFYFSGTGNSLYVAKYLGNKNHEKVVSVASLMRENKNCYEFDLEKNEVIGFVYPVYAWAPPKQILQFIEKIKLNNYDKNYIFTVATCGENIGNTVEVLSKALSKKSLILNSGFSIKMPNNYIIMGDVDNKKVEDKKLLEAENFLLEISEVINEKKDKVYKVEKGLMPAVLTSIINPLFNKGGTNTKKFHVNNNCTACGFCEKVCNCGTIKVDKKPVWGEECSQCLACIHLCPTKAIEYGKSTKKKGRYKHPRILSNEMIVNYQTTIK
jgi:NAD-dependent dihydropyrimidine dehydrogenase PreA subunit